MIPYYDNWKTTPPEELEAIEENLNNPGYKEIGTGIFVPEEDAFSYAIEQCVEIAPEGFHQIDWTQEFKEMLVEWFYSGNWLRRNDGTD